MSKKLHWTQTPEGRARMSKLMTGRKKRKSGLAGSKKGITRAVPVDLRSAIVYLQQSQGSGPRMARCLVELALLTLLGEK